MALGAGGDLHEWYQSEGFISGEISEHFDLVAFDWGMRICCHATPFHVQRVFYACNRYYEAAISMGQ
jgi:hypothetical protein